MKFFVIADTHFGHHYLSQSGTRPANFTERTVAAWKSTVTDEDLLLHLGDVTFQKSADFSALFSTLPGRKILVRGNHDRSKGYGWWMRHGFLFVAESFTWEQAGFRLLFTHEPAPASDSFDYNIHGHLHVCDREVSEKHVLVSLEKLKYRPILLDSLLHPLIKRKRGAGRPADG